MAAKLMIAAGVFDRTRISSEEVLWRAAGSPRAGTDDVVAELQIQQTLQAVLLSLKLVGADCPRVERSATQHLLGWSDEAALTCCRINVTRLGTDEVIAQLQVEDAL